MIGGADGDIRTRVFEWLTRQREGFGESLARSTLEAFSLDGRRIPLVGPSGIWKPAACELPLSITTTFNSTYDDTSDPRTGMLGYAYRGTDAQHRDNRGLRRAMLERVPVVYFYSIEPGIYAAAYPAFIIEDHPAQLRFSVQVDDLFTVLRDSSEYSAVAEDIAEPRRAYVTATVRRRLHQVAFRERVIRAYAERCALCRLHHLELLDAAHITPDSEAEGEPVISNGVALCKLHHAAFDRHFFAIRPDYSVEVRPSVLEESDGPMLVVGLQKIHGQLIHLPSRAINLPDRARLERRYEQFRQAVG
jgi:putative restriction endonuclease